MPEVSVIGYMWPSNLWEG